jgi:hypothetical protein
MDNSLLQQLKDIKTPSDSFWWPLAPGWYGLLLLGLIVMAGIGYWIFKRLARKKQLQWLQHELYLIETKLTKQDPTAITDCSTLLRRAALSQFPRQDVAGLAGDAWLNFLDETLQTKEFTQGSGRLLITAAYQQQWQESSKDVFLLTKQWVQSCLK